MVFNQACSRRQYLGLSVASVLEFLRGVDSFLNELVTVLTV